MSEVKTTSLAAFASQLRAWRRQMEWTQVQLGDKIGYSASLISGIETMDKESPTAPFAKACDHAFSTPGTFAELQRLVAREAYPAFFAPVVPYEQKAVRIHGWELGAVPGLLQTGDYARALIRISRPMDSDSAVDRLVMARVERQDILSGENPPMLWYVIDESVLRHETGGREVMTGQLDRLIEAAAVPGIVAQVLPFKADHAGTDGPISVYEFTTATPVGYTECYAGGRIVEDHVEVTGLIMVMNLIRASALSPRDSLGLIRKIRSELDD
jgi:transcriptional regulator with XRE-family HTH domain